MTFLRDLLGMLAFRTRAIRAQAERQALTPGIVCFCAGYLVYALVRNSVYEAELSFPLSGLIGSFFNLNLIQAVLFPMLVYIPVVIALSNALSGDGFGLSISRQAYRAHLSALMPLLGMVFLIAAPLQWLAPLPRILEVGEIVEIEFSIAALVRWAFILIYTLWAIKQLNYLSGIQSVAVFALSWFTLPVYYILARFVLALPFFIMIPLIYLGYQWIRGHMVSQTNEHAFQQNLHTLTLNPQDADAHYQLGLIHLKRRNLEAARRYFESALKIDARDPEYHYSLGRVHELKGEWAPALEHYEETYRLNPEYGLGDIFREVGKGYLHTGSVEKGMEFLRFFLSKRGSDPEGRYWLAMALQKTGDFPQMRAQLNTIVEQVRLNPRFFRKENREWIYRARNMIRNSKFEFRN